MNEQMKYARRLAAQVMGFSGEGQIYTFWRLNDGKEFFYPLELKDDAEAKANAECNPGTIRVEDIDRNIVWRLQ